MFQFSESKINPAYLGNRMKRFLAFCVDIFPINFIVIMVYRQFSNYDQLMEPLIADPNNQELQEAILPMMNTIGMICGGVYLVYCFLMEASEYQATFGKKLFRLKVVNHEGEYITPKDAFWRNAFKIISHTLASIGFFWILFDRQKRGWHDIIGKTLVVDQDYESSIPEELIQQLDDIQDQPYHNTASTLSGSNFNTLQEGNQTNLLYPPSTQTDYFQLIKSQSPKSKERLLQYKKDLIDHIWDNNQNIPDDLLWNNSTLGQKMLHVFFTFDGHMKETGSFDFVFYNSEFIFALIDVLETINAHSLLKDYQGLVQNFEAGQDIFNSNRKTYNYPLTTEKEKRDAYLAAKALMPEAHKIDHNYRFDSYRVDLYDQVCHYIESNPGMFI